jgi:hypothetical protein
MSLSLKPMNEAIAGAPSIYAMTQAWFAKYYTLGNGTTIYSGPDHLNMAEIRLTVTPKQRLSALVKTLESVLQRPVNISTEDPSAKPSHFNTFIELGGRYEWVQVIVHPDREHALMQCLNVPKLVVNLDAIWRMLHPEQTVYTSC